MKRGIGMAWQYDSTGQLFLRITKKRGKLTLEEITDLLHYEDSQKYCGRYAIMLNCIEDTIGGNGPYWSYIGALDMARRLGMITNKRRQELCREAEELKEQTEEGGLPS